MKDLQGREYAKLSELKHGDTVELDKGFTCNRAGRKLVFVDAAGKYVTCDKGKHYLEGQGEDCIGVYKV